MPREVIDTCYNEYLSEAREGPRIILEILWRTGRGVGRPHIVLRKSRQPWRKIVENLHGDSESLGEIREIHARPCQTPQKSSQSLRYNPASRWIKIRAGQGKWGGAKP